MKVLVQSVLPCSAEAVWSEVQKSSLLIDVTWPMVTFSPISSKAIPDYWTQGSTVCFRCRLFGVFTFSPRIVKFERIDHARKELQSREHDGLIRQWDHLVRVEVIDQNTTRYTDEIEIDAGLLTIPVVIFAQMFYRHRQRRWIHVARRLAADSMQAVARSAKSDLGTCRVG